MNENEAKIIASMIFEACKKNKLWFDYNEVHKGDELARIEFKSITIKIDPKK